MRRIVLCGICIDDGVAIAADGIVKEDLPSELSFCSGGTLSLPIRAILDGADETSSRILHAIGSLNIGGSQAFVMNLYRNIDRSRVQFDFVIEHPGELCYRDEIESLGGRVFELQSFRGTNLVAYRRQWRELLDEHPEWRVLHSHVRSTASLYLPIAKRRGIETIIHSHSTAEAPGFSGAIKRIFELPLRRQADFYFACSNKAGEFLYGKRLAASDKLIVIANAIDVERFRFSSQVCTDVRNELCIPGNAFVVGHVGRFVEQKNHPFIIDVFCEILMLIPSAKLVLAGDGPLFDSVKQLATERGIEDSVLFLGTRLDVNRLYQVMDVFLFPSLNEGLGISLVEAQASGLPCVYSKNIPRDVRVVAPLCQSLSLNDCPRIWAEACCTTCTEDRFSSADKVIEAGFDLRSTTLMLQDFYYRLDNGLKANIREKW
ncbi:glycosyltransferase family 1 protein [Adlercreutzia sp. ZJ304]|uniref:glycosyltransferase family 1 protein n=1 Tax=Adlercreutzia sp. ZJ304 TaxID=2709791 RepID=UPI0013EBDB78|nr:glycosyltransferase family 1 protein [Adlercreutzia sp. ZJ304]